MAGRYKLAAQQLASVLRHSPFPLRCVASQCTPRSSGVGASSLLHGGKHIVLTMGGAGVLLASARPIPCSTSLPSPRIDPPQATDTSPDIRTIAGKRFSLSAYHFPALPLPDAAGNPGALVDCTGAGDCLVAGLAGGLALGWDMRNSISLGLVSLPP